MKARVRSLDLRSGVRHIEKNVWVLVCSCGVRYKKGGNTCERREIAENSRYMHWTSLSHCDARNSKKFVVKAKVRHVIKLALVGTSVSLC